jgi:hypothetical protein
MKSLLKRIWWVVRVFIGLAFGSTILISPLAFIIFGGKKTAKWIINPLNNWFDALLDEISGDINKIT